MTIDAFIKSLASYEGALTFNPWKDTDLRYEVENAPSIRKEQLHDYLSRRVGKAKLLLIAEACGYQGGHFTGIAMTCERMILNEHPAVNSLMILGKEGKRTSRKDSPMIAKPTQKEKGFNEPTDSVVWKACLDAGLSALEELALPVSDGLLGDILTPSGFSDRDLTGKHGQHDAELLLRGDRRWTTHNIQTFQLGR